MTERAKMQQFKILLVDDSKSILRALKRTFKSEGYDIFTAESAYEAMEIFANEEIDLIITDENMPGISGTELLARTRKMYPDVIRMMLTGATDIEVAREAINKGEVYKFFGKPWDDLELLVSVQYALQHRETEKENKRLKKVVGEQQNLLRQLEKEYPGISEVTKANDGTIILENDN